MKLQASLPIFLALTLLLPIRPARAADDLWTIDDQHSSVEFSVKHLMLSTVNGRFNKVRGKVIYDGEHLDKASVEATIDTGSIDTHVHARDEHLLGKDVFDAVKFPTIDFKSTRVVSSKDGSFNIEGILSMHGVSNETVLKAKPLSKIERTKGGEAKTATSATASLNRKDFGITVDRAIDHGGALVGENVKISLNIVLSAKAKTISKLSDEHSQASTK